MNVIKIILSMMLLASVAKAEVGIVVASPENKLQIETVSIKGIPYFLVKQWGWDCPIIFTRGNAYDSRFVKTINGERLIMISMYDGHPQAKGCKKTDNLRPNLKAFNLKKLFADPSLSEASDDFFNGGVSLYVVFGESAPGRYSGNLNAAEIKLADIKEKVKVIYESKFESAPDSPF